jgi:hypothetical protein
MKKLTLLLIIPILFSNLVTQALSFQYPMQVGNYWIFKTDTIAGAYNPTTFRIDIEAVDMIGDKSYFRMKQTYTGSMENEWYGWVGGDSTGGIMGAFGQTNDVSQATIYDPPLPNFPKEAVNLGYTWEFDATGMGADTSHWFCRVESISETVIVPAGEFKNCYNIKTIITVAKGDTSEMFNNYYADGVGQVLYTGWNFYFNNFRFELTDFFVQPVVKVGESQEILHGFCVEQNYPNPFNPVTTISYRLPKSAVVNLSIYNTAGQLVKTIVNEQKHAGHYSAVWDARDVSSGVYYYRITSGEFSEIKKALFMK